jgi:hypothetical protein
MGHKWSKSAAAVIAAIGMASAAVAMPASASARLAAHAATAAHCSTRTVQPAKRGSQTVLTGASVLSACDAWIAGTSRTGSSSAPLLEHWNGHGWRITSAPDPGGAAGVQAIAALSAHAAWAVGSHNVGSNAQPLILRWNGRKWRTSPVPDPGGTAQYNSLSSVAVSSATSAWAVGLQSPASGEIPFAVHWTGRKWKKVPVPVPAGSSNVLLRSVTVAPHGTAWAVGQFYNGSTFLGLIEHWLHGRWHIVPAGEPTGSDLWSVTMAGPNRAWAVGYSYNGTVNIPLILRLNHGAWHSVPQPVSGGGQLNGVTAAAGPAWAVGYVNGTAGTATLLMQWSRGKWRRLHSKSPGGPDDLNSLSGVSGTNCGMLWAAGYFAAGLGPATGITARC